MLFPVPVRFDITATRLEGGRRQSTQAWSIVDFEIPEFDPDDAPVAVSWKQDFGGALFAYPSSQEAVGPSPRDKPMHVRKIGYQFYRPLMRERSIPEVKVVRHGEDADFLAAGTMLDMLRNFTDTGVFTTVLPGDSNRKRLVRNGGDGLTEFVSIDHHSRDRAVQEIRKRIARFVIVDGLVYERCPEPVVVTFTADTVGEPGRGTFAMVTTDAKQVARADARNEVFQLEDYASALKKVSRSNASRPGKLALSRINESLAPDIDNPESIYQPDVAWMRQVDRLALHVVGWVGEQKASLLSDGLFSGYRNVFTALHMAEGEERFDLFATGFQEVFDASLGTEWEHLAEKAQKAIDLLESRPVALGPLNVGLSPASM